MKIFVILTCCLILCSSTAIAQTVQRDALIDRVESHYLRETVFSVESPFLDRLLESAKSANPGVTSDTWLIIKKDVAPKIIKVLIGKGSPMDLLLRKVLEKLSDEELDHLDSILSDPVFSKLQTATAGPAFQKEYLKAISISALQFGAIINGELVHNGLKEVH